MIAHRTVDTWTELAAWLARHIDALDADCNDGETIGSIGLDAHKRSLVRVAAYRDVLHEISPAVEAEAAERAETAAQDSIEARYKAAYGDEPLAPWQAEGR